MTTSGCELERASVAMLGVRTEILELRRIVFEVNKFLELKRSKFIREVALFRREKILE